MPGASASASASAATSGPEAPPTASAKTGFGGPSKLVALPAKAPSRCVAAAPRAIGKSAIVPRPGSAPSVAIAATSEGVLAAWTTTDSPTPTPVVAFAMLDGEGKPKGEAKKVPLEHADFLAAAPLVDGSFVLFVGGTDGPRGSALQLLTFDRRGEIVHPIASQHVEGRGEMRFRPATSGESGAVLVGWIFQSNEDVIHYHLVKAVFHEGAAASLVSTHIADKKFPNWGNGTWIKLGPGERGLVEWGAGQAWELGGGKVSLDAALEKQRGYASYAYEQDGSLVGSGKITGESEYVEGYRRAKDGTWSAAELPRKLLFKHPPRIDVRDLPVKDGGISLLFGNDLETAITTSDVPDERSSAAWTGERFLVGFPARSGDGFAIYVSAVTCSP